MWLCKQKKKGKKKWPCKHSKPFSLTLHTKAVDKVTLFKYLNFYESCANYWQMHLGTFPISCHIDLCCKWLNVPKLVVSDHSNWGPGRPPNCTIGPRVFPAGTLTNIKFFLWNFENCCWPLEKTKQRRRRKKNSEVTGNIIHSSRLFLGTIVLADQQDQQVSISWLVVVSISLVQLVNSCDTGGGPVGSPGAFMDITYLLNISPVPP